MRYNLKFDSKTSLHTWIQEAVCWRGEMKKVPSISGYLNQRTTVVLTGTALISLYLPFKDDHLGVTENTGNLVHLVSGVTRENEAPRLVVPNTALIFHLRTFRCEIFQNLHLKLFMFYLDVIRIYLLSWKHIECTVVVSPKENTATAVVPNGNSTLVSNGNRDQLVFLNSAMASSSSD